MKNCIMRLARNDAIIDNANIHNDSTHDTIVNGSEDQNNITVQLDFDTASAHLLSSQDNCYDYDALTLFKTARRLQNNISVFPLDVQ